MTRSLFPGADEGSIASGLEDDAAEKGDEREAGEQSFDGDEDALGPRDADEVAHDVDGDVGDDVAHDVDGDAGDGDDDRCLLCVPPVLAGASCVCFLFWQVPPVCASCFARCLLCVPPVFVDASCVCFLFSQIKSGKAVLTQLKLPCDAVVDSQEMVVVAMWRHQKRHIVGMQEEEGGRNQWRRVSPLPHLGKLTRIRPSVQRPAAVQAAEAFCQRFQSKGPDCNPVWAPGAEDKAPRNNVPKKPAKRTTTPGAVNSDPCNSQKKPRLNNEEVVGQPVTASFDTDALAAAVYNTLQNRHLLGSQETQEVHYLLSITIR